jgi:hypothetical protein
MRQVDGRRSTTCLGGGSRPRHPGSHASPSDTRHSGENHVSVNIGAATERHYEAAGDKAHEAARTMRRIMTNIADGALVDVRGISLADLDAEPIALDRALARILTPSDECRFSSFTSSI